MIQCDESVSILSVHQFRVPYVTPFIVYNAKLLVWYTHNPLAAPPSQFSSVPCVTLYLGTERQLCWRNEGEDFKLTADSFHMFDTVLQLNEWYRWCGYRFVMHVDARRYFPDKTRCYGHKVRGANWKSHLVIVSPRDVVCSSSLRKADSAF